MTTTLGITSAQLAGAGSLSDAMGYELFRLMEEGRKRFDEVLLINPARIVFLFDRQRKIPAVMTGRVNLACLSSLIVRKTTGYEEPIALLARTLYHYGCDILDPVERFSGSPAGKLMESLRGHAKGTLPETYIAFNRDEALQLIGLLNRENRFPLIGKPNRGSRGENVQLLKNPAEAFCYINDFFQHEGYAKSALILQRFVKVEKEFRVMLLNGKCLGMAEKIGVTGQIARNAALGSQFIEAHDDRIVAYTLQHASRKGLLGADVVRDASGNLFLLEANRAPQWQAFEKATGINVARCIIEHMWWHIHSLRNMLP